MCQPSCGCKGKSESKDCESIIIACKECWGNDNHPAEKGINSKDQPWNH